MDTELLRTFLEVERTRHFGRAAENLYITPAAVGARIRLLEQTLGTQVLIRKRNAVETTSAGKRLKPQAEAVLNALNRAQIAASSESERYTLSIGAEASLWDVYLQAWLLDYYPKQKPHQLHLESLAAELLRRRLLEYSLDLAIMYQPPPDTELQSLKLATIELVMVSNQAGLNLTQAVQENFLMVDWGNNIALKQARLLPPPVQASAHIGAVRLAYALLLATGGSAYLTASMLTQDIAEQRLHPVLDAPKFSLEVYAVYRGDHARAESLADLCRSLPSH